MSRNSSTSVKNAVNASTSSAMTNTWSSRGGAMPTRSCGRGGGLVIGSMLPTRSMPCTSSTTCPDGASKRIASPQPGPSSRAA